MRKTLVIVFTIALLGGAGLYARKHDSQSSALTSHSTATGTQAASGSSAFSHSGRYKDGSYTGNAADTPYGTVQIAVTISGGKISDVKFLQMPSDEERSRQITQQAEPMLKQVAIDAQSSQIDFVSGATSTSYGYQESLQKALDQAKLS
jgi:uncharacterized protein with FMN-binding domain